jgi:hypothetical protein
MWERAWFKIENRLYVCDVSTTAETKKLRGFLETAHMRVSDLL